MPGIVGLAAPRVDPVEASRAVGRMRELITHRPDYRLEGPVRCGDAWGAGAWLAGSGGGTATVDGVTVWFDGEILALGDEPVRDGARLIAERFAADPSFDYLAEAEGLFAAAVLDPTRRRVHLLTDRYGLRRVLHAEHAGGIAWGSEAKAFLALPGFTPRIDPQALTEYLEVGYLLENRTWLQGVALVPSGSVLTWDLDRGRASTHRYWWWDRIRPLGHPVDPRDAADELARRFEQGVRLRSRGKVGLQLSGGLDSRAILAALPPADEPPHAVTYGVPGSADVELAARAAAVRGARHHVVRLGAEDWMRDRTAGVWWTDGESDLLHMHAVALNGFLAGLFEMNLNGFAGDLIAGGGYLRDRGFHDRDIAPGLAMRVLGCGPAALPDLAGYQGLGKTDYFFLQNRVRRFTIGGTRYSQVAYEHRKPFYHNAFIDFAYALPDRLRADSRVYRTLLLRRYPEYFRTIPWEKTGVSIRHGALASWLLRFPARAGRRVLRALGRLEVGQQSYTDYPAWLRRAPERDFFAELLTSPRALAPELVPGDVIRRTWERHQRGENLAERIGRYATLEVWLRQVFEGTLRPGAAA